MSGQSLPCRFGRNYKSPATLPRFGRISPVMTVRMMIGAVGHLVVFPVQHKFIRRAPSLCVHKFLQIINLQSYCPAFHSWKYPPGHVRIAINRRLTRTHCILFFNRLNFANERPENPAA
jgi:hypothetical protein